MSFGRYLKDRWKTGVLLILGVASLEVFLLVFPVHWSVRLYGALGVIGLYVLGVYLEYREKKTFYVEILENLQALEEKYLVCEMLPEPRSLEEECFREILLECDRSMLENVNHYKRIQEEYKEYIELWIHEVKLPIATSRMILENNPGPVAESLGEELTEIEEFVEQALYYARSSQVSKDYFITRCTLKSLVSEAVRMNRKSLIRNHMRILIELEEESVFTDSKWCVFILRQIIGNSVKYRKGCEGEIRFWALPEKDKVVLCISDRGIGMKPEETGRVFEKGFTGSNGRNHRKSTGIGLYLCRKLCLRLGLGIEFESLEGEGSTVKIIFPKNSYILTD